MSTVTDGEVAIKDDQAVHATRLLCEALGLSIPKAQLKFLAIALAETATEKIRQDDVFAERIKTRFENLLPKPRKKQKVDNTPTRQPREPKQKLIPIKHLDADRLNPYGTPDPYALLEAFGGGQLALALKEYSLPLLNRVAAEVQAKNPNTVPTNKRQKDSVVDYIVQHVTQQP